MAKVKSNAHLYFSVPGATAPASVALTAVTIVNPVHVTATVTGSALVNGDFVLIQGTGKPYLDGDYFRVSNVTPTGFDLPDANGPSIGTPAPTTGTYTPYTLAGVTPALLTSCMANVTLTGQSPDTINMDDMCGTSTQYGNAKPPTFTFQGWSDQASAGYKNLWRCSITDPKPIVQCLIDYGSDAGCVMGTAQVGEITITAANSQGLQFSGAGVFTAVPTYSWAL